MLLTAFTAAQCRLRIAVIGDCMVDEYYYVHVNRLSPEFPIPVWLSPGDDMLYARPGGAANVAYQFRHFNHDVEVVGFINPYAESVLDACGVKHGASWHGSCQVPVKRRLYHGDFPLCRWDIERENYGLTTPESWEALAAYKERPDVIIFSDYNKGVFTGDWFQPLLASGVPTIVDPKNDIEKWKGCTVFKPNAVEAEKLSGLSRWQDQARYFLDRLQCAAVVITQGGNGVVGCWRDQEFQYRPTAQTATVSLQGAGDCFIAFLAMAIGQGYDPPQAAQIAFEAGAVYVQNKHNEPIRPEQLRQREDPLAAKYVKPAFLAARDYKLVFANGCFDIMHHGHLAMLQIAKSQGDKLLVAVNSDASVTRLKGAGRPINTVWNRMRLLAALEFVDYVVPFEEDTPLAVIQAARPDVIVKGEEYAAEDVVGYGLAKVVLAPMVEGVSTTKILSFLNLTSRQES